jgi:hypothetical protein
MLDIYNRGLVDIAQASERVDRAYQVLMCQLCIFLGLLDHVANLRAFFGAERLQVLPL